MSEIDYSRMKGIADEAHWNEFVLSVGGEFVGPHIKRQGVKNADYMFPRAKVIAELKILQTEFAHTRHFQEKIDAIIKKYPNADPADPALRRELFMLLRKPLQRIITGANRQIKETKRELGLDDWSGVLICVNDGFRGVPPALPLGLLANILSKTSYTNTDAFIYQTNHFVELPDSPYAMLLWHPAYSDKASDKLVEFVNDLGRKWNAFADAVDGPYDIFEEREITDLRHASVVSGVRRNRRYEGP